MLFTLQYGDYEFPNQSFEIRDDTHANNIKEEFVVQKHGAEIQAPYLRPKKIKVEGEIHNSTKEASHTELLALQAALLNTNDFFRHSSDKEINTYCRNLKAEYAEGTDKRVIDIAIDLIAKVPFYQSAGASISTIQAISGTTVSFDVANDGNVNTEAKVYILADGGTISDSVQVTNQTNDNQQSKFRGDVANGTTLLLDTTTLSVENNAVVAMTYFEGTFIRLVPGTNTIEYVGADCQVTLEHKHRWY